MGNCVGRADQCVLPHDRHKWIAKCGQQVFRGFLDYENNNLMAFERKCAATDTALYCHKNLYSSFDPCSLPLAPELRLIDPMIVEKLAADRRSSKRSVVAPDTDPESPIICSAKENRREMKLIRIQRVTSAKEKSAPCKLETAQSTAADLDVYVVTWNMNGKVRKFHR